MKIETTFLVILFKLQRIVQILKLVNKKGSMLFSLVNRTAGSLKRGRNGSLVTRADALGQLPSSMLITSLVIYNMDLKFSAAVRLIVASIKTITADYVTINESTRIEIFVKAYICTVFNLT